MNRASLLLILFCSATLLLGQPALPQPHSTTIAPHPDHPAESREYLLELIHHLYLWYHDESFFPPGEVLEELEVYFRTTERPLDPGDNSQFGELYFPATQMLVELKRSDYHIAEIDHPVKDASFKIRRVERVAKVPAPREDYQITTIPRAELRDWFSNHAHQAPPMAENLSVRIRDTLLHHQFQEQWDEDVVHIFYLAPLSNVSNDIWILHENTKQLLQFSADMDIDDPATWGELSLRLKFHQLDPGRILTPDRDRGGEGELSKDFVGRALFNCVVLGNRIEVLPESIQEFLDNRSATADTK